MKKINLLAITIVFLMAQTIVFGSDMHKPDMSSGDSVAKCPEMNIIVKEVKAVKALTINATAPSMEVGAKLGELYPKLMNYIKEKEIQMAGPPFAIYHKWDPQGDTELAAGIPVAAETGGEGEIEYVEFPAMKVVTSIHFGPYESLGPVYEDIQKYINKKGLKINGSSWELYLIGPDTETDANKYQTQIYFPVE